MCQLVPLKFNFHKEVHTYTVEPQYSAPHWEIVKKYVISYQSVHYIEVQDNLYLYKYENICVCVSVCVFAFFSAIS